VSARFDSTAAARCTSRGATSAACSAIRSRRSRSSTPVQARSHTAWHAWLRSPLQLLSELGHVASPARSVSRLTPTDRDSRGPRCGCAGARRAGARLDLQRAADHRGVGRGDLQGSTRGRAQDGVRLERQRDTAGARLRAAAPRLLQGRSQVLRRSPLSRARRPHRADRRLDPADSRSGAVAGDRHAADSRLQRRRGRAEAADGIRRGGLTRHPVARDSIPCRLQDDAIAATHRATICCAPPRLAETPACDSCMPEIVPEKSATSKTRTARHAARPSCRGWAIT